MKHSLLFSAVSALAVSAIVLTSCSENNEPEIPAGDNEDKGGKFVIATTVKGSNATSYVLLTAETLDKGTLSAVNSGLVNDGASQWVFHGSDYLYALTYNQGNAGTTRSYTLGADGTISPRDMEYKISRYTSYGIYDNCILSMSTGNGQESQADANGYLPKTLLLTYLNVDAETSRSNDTSAGTYSMENYLGKEMPKLGFGLMRLPEKDGKIDIE